MSSKIICQGSQTSEQSDVFYCEYCDQPSNQDYAFQIRTRMGDLTLESFAYCCKKCHDNNCSSCSFSDSNYQKTSSQSVAKTSSVAKVPAKTSRVAKAPAKTSSVAKAPAKTSSVAKAPAKTSSVVKAPVKK